MLHLLVSFIFFFSLALLPTPRALFIASFFISSPFTGSVIPKPPLFGLDRDGSFADVDGPSFELSLNP